MKRVLILGFALILPLSLASKEKKTIYVRAVTHQSSVNETRTQYTTPGSSQTHCSGDGTTFGSGTNSTTNLDMSCRTTSTPSQTHSITTRTVDVVNRVEADGVIYTISCTANWVGSNCSTMIDGDTFKAEIDGQTMWIYGHKGGNQGKEVKAKYRILDIRLDSKPQEVQKTKTPAPEARTTIDAPSATDNSGFPSRWKSLTSGATRALRFAGEYIYTEIVLSEDAAETSEFFRMEVPAYVRLRSDKYVGEVSGRLVRRDHGASCPVSWPVELTLVTKDRIEGRSFGPPNNAKIDWSTCSPSLPAEWHAFTWIPVR